MKSTPHTSPGAGVARRNDARSQIGQYGMMPVWLLESSVGPIAIRLYGFIAGKYADRSTDTCHPSRRALAKDLRVSERTVDRAIAELQALGALIVEHRRDPFGDLTTNLYTIIFNEPEALVIARQAPVTEGRFGTNK